MIPYKRKNGSKHSLNKSRGELCSLLVKKKLTWYLFIKTQLIAKISLYIVACLLQILRTVLNIPKDENMTSQEKDGPFYTPLSPLRQRFKEQKA